MQTIKNLIMSITPRIKCTAMMRINLYRTPLHKCILINLPIQMEAKSRIIPIIKIYTAAIINNKVIKSKSKSKSRQASRKFPMVNSWVQTHIKAVPMTYKPRPISCFKNNKSQTKHMRKNQLQKRHSKKWLITLLKSNNCHRRNLNQKMH